MSKRNNHSMRRSEQTLGRHRQARRALVLCEALEKRCLLSGYAGYTFTLANQGSSTANGTYLQDIINGTTLLSNSQISNHTLTLGDTLILPDGYDYNMGSGELQLPNLGAAATATESGGAVTSLSLSFTPAGGYSAAPTVSIFGGGGTGATGTVTYNSTTGAVTGITLGNHGSGYTAAPTVAILGGAETLSIESSAYYNEINGGGTNGLSAGRFIPATEENIGGSNIAQITSTAVNGIIVETVLSDSHNHFGAAQNYSFDGIEMCPNSATIFLSSGIVDVGTGSAQNYDQLVPSNFTFNQDYVHGGAPGETSDDLNTAALEHYVDSGFELNANYVTIENSQISDIHAPDGTIEAHGIVGWNALGNFTIENNYIEATGEGILLGGTAISLPSPAQPNNDIIEDNYFTKNLAWDPNAPQFAGVPMDVKNDLEIKTGENITVSHNIFENIWIGADQRGEAINLSNISSGAPGYPDTNPWTDVADITITDNVIRNCEQVIEINGGEGYKTGEYDYSEIAHDIIFSNNLAYNIGGPEWGPWGSQEAIQINASGGAINNLTIENNTIIGDDGYASVSTGSYSNVAAVANFVCINNVFEEGIWGIFGDGEGSDEYALNGSSTYPYFSALTITNPGSGYTAAPTVTISASPLGGTNTATAMAYLWPSGFPLSGQLLQIIITNNGSGYTSTPTITLSGGLGSGGTAGSATAMTPVNGQIRSYDFNGNIIIGGSSSNYPAGTTNSFPATENAVEFLDIAGDEYGILSTTVGGGANPYYTAGTGSSTPGVNMSGITGTNNAGGDTVWGPSDATNSLQNYYKFDEGTGTTAYDNGLGTHENATLSSSSLWTTSGYMNDGIALTGGSSGSVSVANFSADASFTFAAWVKPTSISGTQYIGSTANSAFSLYLNSGVLTATGTTGTATGTTLTAGQWSLVSATYSSGTLTLYVNGAEVGSTISATTTTGTTTLYIGDNKGSVSSFNGTIDEVRYYSTALAENLSVIGNNYLGYAGGSGYSSSTNGFAVSFSGGGGGSGAAATAYAENNAGEITSVILTNPGSGYTAAPTISFSSGGGTGASDIAAMSPDPLSYLYTQYGPQIQETTYGSASTTNTTGSLATYAFTPDENGANAGYSWSAVNYPHGITAPSFSSQTAEDPTVTFHGAGHYLFELTVTNSLGQSASVFLPVTIDPVATPAVAVSPTNITLAPLGTYNAFTVNGTAIANLSGIVDQFGNAMPSSGWSWTVPTPGTNSGSSGLITTPGGVYTAPNESSMTTLTNVIQLKYTTLDAITYTQSTASVIVSSTVPAAPSNLVAKPGTSSIALTWTDPGNTSNVTGYHIWRSTDNATWGSSAYATVAGATASSYTDSATPAGTEYYYEVTAYNSGGDSSPAGMTCGVATVYAYEGFNYPTSSTWSGGNTGLGFTSNWTINTPSEASIVSGLSYSASGHTLTTSGNALQLSNNPTYVNASNTLSQSVGANGTTLWVGFELNGYLNSTNGKSLTGELNIGSGTNVLQLGSPFNSDIDADRTYGTNATYVSTNYSYSANTTYFVAYEIQYLSTGDVISVYADPTPGVLPTTASATKTLASTAPLEVTNAIQFAPNNGYCTDTFDELRLGSSYYSVAPDPLVGTTGSAASTKNKSSFHGRRTSPFLTSTPSGLPRAASSGRNAASDVITKITNPQAYSFYSSPSGGAWRWTSDQDSTNNVLLANTVEDFGNSWKGLFN